MNDIIDVINTNKTFLITAHKNPDGDAIGSSIGLYLALKKINKVVDVVIKDAPKTFSYLEGFDEIKSETNKKYDVLIILDTADEMKVNYIEAFNIVSETVLIDHHISSSRYANYNYVETLSSCSMVILKLIHNLNISLDKSIAEAIYTGLITDTGCYRNKNVDRNTFDVSSELSKFIDVSKVIKLSVGTISCKAFELKKICIENLEFYMSGKIGYSYISEDDIVKIGASYDEASSLVNIAREIEGVEVSIFVRFFKNETRVSFRSNNVDVNKIAQTFGGGGHIYASGLSVDPSLNREKIKNDILIEVEKSINEWNNNCK